MPTPPLDQLRTFLTVYRTASISEAARLLGVSQPTATAHVRALEQRLGFPLFVRGRGGVTATDRAIELAREVGPHIDALDDIEALSGADTAARPIHVGGPAELLSAMVLPRLAEFGVPLRFTFGLPDELHEALRTGMLDLVVSSVRPRIPGIDSAPLYDEEFLLVAAPRWTGEPLAGVPAVAYAGNLPIVRRYWRTVFGRRPDELAVAAVVPDLRGIRSVVLSGVGMSVLPRYLVADDLRAGTLVQLHEPEFAPLNTVHLSARAGEAQREPLAAVVGVITALVR